MIDGGDAVEKETNIVKHLKCVIRDTKTPIFVK